MANISICKVLSVMVRYLSSLNYFSLRTQSLWTQSIHVWVRLELQLHDAIYRLRFYSNSLIHILSLSNSHNNIASSQKNRSDKSHRVNVALLTVTTLKVKDTSIRLSTSTPR